MLLITDGLSEQLQMSHMVRVRVTPHVSRANSQTSSRPPSQHSQQNFRPASALQFGEQSKVKALEFLGQIAKELIKCLFYFTKRLPQIGCVFKIVI